ncbi:Hypothetical predicted protein [Mytilus galloprovincialis]|uniref:Fibrinogen C-terminal domain-containing protein n=1 Tax=Mytilus galloprovincialis TaxID=29158 RepID=A0A8B6G134_MYTGA|nr:Hypothetical predicted protein [Mytilus galloprovincialis]
MRFLKTWYSSLEQYTVMYMLRIVTVLLCFCCSYCIGGLHSFSNKNKIRITSFETYLSTVTVPSSVECARECTRGDCCTACYNKTTNTCHLYRDCFPVTEQSDSGVLLRKNATKPTVHDITDTNGTTLEQISTTGIPTTNGNITYKESDDLTTATKPTVHDITDTSNGSTTLEQISTTGIPTTNDKTTYKESDDLSTATKLTVHDITTNFTTTTDKISTVITIDSTTENETTAMVIDCSDISGGSLSGVYEINVDNMTVEVYCEMRVDGQWTVIQKRLDGTTDFYRNWQEYKDGFGDVNLEYWLGNENLHKLLSTNSYKLRIDLEDWNGDTRYAEYDSFFVGSEETNYMLTISGYSGDAGDSLINPPRGSMCQTNGMEFTTLDSDNDEHTATNAAVFTNSGWWLNWSTDANLNGKFYATEQSQQTDAIYWQSWHASKVSLKSVSMKIKPN